jgi:hypothetical protein
VRGLDDTASLARRVRQWLLDPGSIYQAISAWLALVPKTSSPEEMEVKREELDAMTALARHEMEEVRFH